jgi:UDP-N-acetylmuramoyl-L-alanyl-D-glutamate--2,6-diaminopimelate ligase
MSALLRRLKALIPQRSPLRLSWHRAKGFLAALRYGFPARSLTIIGITGTDGKTTTVGMTAHILQRAGIKTGALSTAFVQIEDQVTWNTTQKTSPSPFMIQKFLRDLVKNECTHAVIEMSSHGLTQGRVLCTWPLVGAITNTSMEHLDYHGSMQQYRADKGILFRMLRRNGTKVLNLEDESYAMYRDIPAAHTMTYATESPNADLSAENIHIVDGRIVATLRQKSGETCELTLAIPGHFNVENALTAIGSALALGIPLRTAAEALKDFRGVPGRMERIDEGQPFSLYVDFTVTPHAYERTLSTLREMLPAGKRLLVLTGSCGDRMREKRPLVGKICSDLGDVVVVTNEDPYTEDPQKIIDEVWAGVDQNACEAHQIFDRGEAMRFIVKAARPGDIVILCAKGSDTTMWVKQGQIPWNEREIARELLRAL